ncbi:MAG: DUF177 domain-containing protein [Clostridia bacterium]|nr:DUF177 domain-containing protein [Clostridia bacterium]
MIDVCQILKNRDKSIDFEFSVHKGDIIIEFPDIQSIGPLVIDGTLTNDGENLIMNGSMKGEIQLKCSRCLEPFTFEINTDLFQEFTMDGDKAKEQDIYLIKDNEIDLMPLIQENILLSIPTKSLCKDDCKGLCQQCGTNLNYQDCNCVEHDDIDIRLSALKDLFKEDKEVEPNGCAKEENVKSEKR